MSSMSEKTESQVLSLAESDDSDSEELINLISEFFVSWYLDQYFSLGSRLGLRLLVFKIGSDFEYFISY